LKGFNYLYFQDGFLESKKDYRKSKGVIIGAPMDFTVSYRPGQRFGPQKIREVSYGLEDYSPYAHDSLKQKSYFDAGDLDIPFGNVIKSLEIIEETAQKLLADDKVPFFLGGEHLISYPIVRAVAKKYPDVIILHFDAHADLRDTYMGEKLSHATVLRRISEVVKNKHIYQFGIRSGIEEEFIFAKDHCNTNLVEVKTPFIKVLPELLKRPIYVTLDIDVVDPAYAPGTGTPEPGGCSSQEILDVISHFEKLHIVGVDLVEVLPTCDLSERTALLAAKILREIIIGLC